MNVQKSLQGDPTTMLQSLGHARSSSTSLLADVTAPVMNNDDELAKVQIYKDLCEYEDVLGQLVDGVDSFKPDVLVAKNLINVDKKLFESLESFAEYDRIDSELKRLDLESQELEEKTREILETLNDCYNKLNTLPMLEQVNIEKNTILKQRAKINSTVLLEYATKLSKFTKIPPTFDKGTIGPNNFIWPAEDALRRGMLAMASLHTKELTKVPGEVKEEAKQEEAQGPNWSQAMDEDQSETQKQENPLTERRQSYVFTGDGEGSHDRSDDAIDLDLDLFNADEF